MSGEGVLLTGARGYLGSRLSAELAGAAPLCADITDRDALARAFEAAPPASTLVHLAAANEIVCAENFERGVSVNVIGTRNVLDAAAAAGIRRVVFFSTFHVYGEPGHGATISETTVPDPIHPYGITKLAGEQLCKAAARRHGLTIAIIRLSNGVGTPADPAAARWNLVLLDLCRQAHEKRGLTLRSSGVQQRDFVSIDDIGHAVRLLVSADASQLDEPVVNLGSGVSVSIRSVATWVQEAYLAMYGERIALSAPEHSGPVPPPFTYDIGKIRGLGFTPRTDLHAEIKNTLQYCERFRA